MILTPENVIWLREKNCVLLDGTFDPLHAGHIRYFTEAIKAFPSHLLLVSVAADDDIRAKGREPLLDQATRCTVVQAAMGGGYAIAKDSPTEHLIGRLKPGAYVKGKDWEGQLPAEQLAACSLNGVQIVYLDTVEDSSSARLRAWALRDAERGVDRLEAYMAAQLDVPPETYDTEYFVGDWRKDVPPYTLEGRREAEGRHPKIVKECFDGLTVLDVGCGPGHFVRMLRELGMDAGGIDPSRDAVALSNGIKDRVVHAHVDEMPRKIAHVAICREVLEHLTVRQVAEMVCQLFRVARKFVYITTRFNDLGAFDVTDERSVDPTHQTLLSQPFLRSLCVLNGGRRRRDIETKLDHLNKGRVLVYEVQ